MYYPIKKNYINCSIASKVFQTMPKCKLSEIKKVDFLNNQILFDISKIYQVYL